MYIYKYEKIPISYFPKDIWEFRFKEDTFKIKFDLQMLINIFIYIERVSLKIFYNVEFRVLSLECSVYSVEFRMLSLECWV